MSKEFTITIGKLTINSYWDYYDWDWEFENVGAGVFYNHFITLWHPFGHINILWRNNVPTPW